MDMKQHYRLDVSPVPTSLGHDRVGGEPPRQFDPCLDAPVFGAVNLAGDTDSTAARLAAIAVFASGGALRLRGDHCLVAQMTELERLSVALVNAALI